jgi:hypothetical protein
MAEVEEARLGRAQDGMTHGDTYLLASEAESDTPRRFLIRA